MIEQTHDPSPRRLRPWYFVGAMCVMWMVGVVGTMRGCQEIEYLRGSREVPDKLDKNVEESTHPLFRAELVRQKARLEALGKHHRRSFPVAALRMLVAIVLVLGAGAALVGRRGSRQLALQAVLANAAAAGIAFAVMEPVRMHTANIVAQDAVEHTVAVEQGATRQHVIDEQRALALSRDNSLAALEIAVFAAAILALTRRRTKVYFEAMEEAVADAQE